MMISGFLGGMLWLAVLGLIYARLGLVLGGDIGFVNHGCGLQNRSPFPFAGNFFESVTSCALSVLDHCRGRFTKALVRRGGPCLARIMRKLGDLYQADPIGRGDFRCIGLLIHIAVIHLPHPVGAEGLHACRAGHGRGSHDFRFAALE